MAQPAAADALPDAELPDEQPRPTERTLPETAHPDEQPRPAIWSLTDAELAGELHEVFAGEQALAARRLTLVREIDGRGLAIRDGATSIVTWLRDRLRVSPRSAKRMVELARALDDELHSTAQALQTSAINEEQAATIARAIAALPAEAGKDVRAKAERFLLEESTRFEPNLLARLGSRVLENVAPDLADEALRRQLERDEARADRDRTFTLSPMSAGRVRLFGWLGAEAAAIVSAALDPLCAPGRLPYGAVDAAALLHDDRTPGQRRADALVEVCRLALASGELPANGGDRPQVVVTMPHEQWRDQLPVGTLENGQAVSPQTMRRLACDASVIPAVLGSQGQVLDLGRGRRLFNGSIRRALAVRDGGCAFPACDRPPKWCDAHHIVSWLDGGPTDLDNGVLLCWFHHRVIHQTKWVVRMGDDGLPDFIPPAYIDPRQLPRRNAYHRRV